MSSAVSFSSLVALRDGCRIAYEVGGSGTVWFRVGTPEDGLEFDFESEALREFVRLGAEALTEMDARYTEEEAAERDAT
jgi:hypothetical protein